MIIEKDFIYVDLPKNLAEHTGAVWNEKTKKYRLPNTIGVLYELYKIGRTEMYSLLERKEKQRNVLLELKRRNDAPGPQELRPYQRVDLNYLMKLGSAGIFNEQRTGKTPTTLKLIEAKGFERGVVVCPASLLINWKEEIERWTKLQANVVLGSKKKRIDCYQNWLQSKKLLIISYETLRNDLTTLLQMLTKSKITLDVLIVDEAHRLRSLINGRKASGVSKAVLALGKHAGTRYALTGTPVVRDGQEIWGILHFLYPEKFPGYWQFLERYFIIGSNGFGAEIKGYKREKELQDILAVMSVNRKRAEVMKWLPAKQYQKIALEMNSKQQKVYVDVKNTFEYEDIIDAPSVLAQLTRLRQIATCPGILVEGVKNEKEKFILEWLEDNQEPVVIFSTFSSYLERLKNVFYMKDIPVGMITGKVSKQERDNVVKKFQNGEIRIILANIKAAGTGLTLDRGETVIFLDKEYNPSDNEQAEDRIVPTTKERNHSMTVISLVMQNSVDEMIHDLLEKKVDITSVINNGGIAAMERLWKNETVR